MSDSSTKTKRSKRRSNSRTAAKKQYDIAKSLGLALPKSPHEYSKRKALNCGNPNCVLCGNPRKFYNEKTVQEQRIESCSQDTSDE